MLVRGLALREITLVVHELALEADGLVQRVVVLNTWMWPSDGDRTIARIDRVVRSWMGRCLYRWLGFSARVILPSAFGVKARLTKRIHGQYIAPLSRSGGAPFRTPRSCVSMTADTSSPRSARMPSAKGG
jgi:hypothetical protein